MKIVAHPSRWFPRIGRRAPRALLTSTGFWGWIILAGCGGGGPEAEAPDPVVEDRIRVESLVQAVLEAHGGEGDLRAVRGYRAEGTITALHDGSTGETVRWFQRPDHLRVELRYADRGEVRIARGPAGWAGPDDRKLVSTAPPFLDSIRLQAARLDLPLRLLEHRETLVIMNSDDAGRLVARSFLDEELTLDYHINPRTYRIEAITSRITGKDPIAFSVRLSEFRWVEGVLFAFREVLTAGDTPTAEVRIESIEVNPRLPRVLFNPGTP